MNCRCISNIPPPYRPLDPYHAFQDAQNTRRSLIRADRHITNDSSFAQWITTHRISVVGCNTLTNVPIGAQPVTSRFAPQHRINFRSRTLHQPIIRIHNHVVSTYPHAHDIQIMLQVSRHCAFSKMDRGASSRSVVLTRMRHGRRSGRCPVLHCAKKWR